MEPGKPSRTALGAAGHRMLHQLVDRPLLLDDKLALTILGPPPAAMPSHDVIAANAAASATLRAQIVSRSLFAEETLAKGVARGVDQYVLLGAGLDTFAYRNPYPNLRVFEVDNPDTGRWKQERLAANSIAIPPSVTYAAIDFERETVPEALAKAGFNLARPAVFAWLGVTVYLTREAIAATLRSVGSLATGTEIVFDYGEPRALPEAERARLAERMAELAAMGEPWISFLAPAEVAAMLSTAGFSESEDLAGHDINARWFAGRTEGLATRPGAHLVRAKV